MKTRFEESGKPCFPNQTPHKKMLQMGMDKETVSKATGLAKQEIENLS